MTDLQNNKEMIAIGHEFARSISSDTPIIEIAKMITRLAGRLDCATLALREMTKQRDAADQAGRVWERTMMDACGEDGPKSVADKFAEMKARCAALAAENAALKDKGRELITEACSVYEKFNAIVNHETGDFIDGQTLHEFQVVLNCETPATDAFLAEVRASGIDAWIESRGDKWNGTTKDAERFAAQLRQEAAK